MFDTIYIQKDLPLTKTQKKTFSHIDWKNQPFQTKDLENALSKYTLNKSGKLYTTKIEGEHVRVMTEAEEKKVRKKDRWVWPYEFIEKSRKEVLVKHTGTISFYDIVNDKEGNEWWIEFEAKIVDGSLKGKFQTIKFEINRTKKEIDEDEKAWKDKVESYNNKPTVKFRKFMNKITYSYWYKFWNFISRVIRKSSEKLSSFSWWIIKNIA